MSKAIHVEKGEILAEKAGKEWEIVSINDKIKRAYKMHKMDFTAVKEQKLFTNILATALLQPRSNGPVIKMLVQKNIGNKYSATPGSPVNSEKSGNFDCNVSSWDLEVQKDAARLNPLFKELYVGAIYPYKEILSGNYNTVPYERKPITILGTASTFTVSQKTIPVPNHANVQTATNAIIQSSNNVPGGRSVTIAEKYYSSEDLYVKTGGSGWYLFAGGSHSISYNETSNTHKYYFELWTEKFDIVLNDDIKTPAGYFQINTGTGNSNRVKVQDINPNWVVIDSITYGRCIILSIESYESFESHSVDVNAYAKFLVAGGELDLTEKQKSSLKIANIKATILGDAIGGMLTLYDGRDISKMEQTLKQFLTSPSTDVPIKYSLKTLDGSNVGVKLTTQFVARECAPRASRVRVTWTNLNCVTSTDGGGFEDVNARVRIRAINDQGKDIMDEEKKNQHLINMEKVLPGSVPTFSVGSVENPFSLYAGQPHAPNKSLTFRIPSNDENAKVAIRVNLTEVDTGPNDEFTSDTFSIKVKDLTSMHSPTLRTTERGSIVDFSFKVEPLYDLD